jgi:lysozyme
MNRARGTDVSKYQGEVPWADMAKAGVEFAICKATEGHGYVDPSWETTLQAAPFHMRAVGCYHVLRAGSPQKQAAHHAAQWERLVIECEKTGAAVIPPCMDFELLDKQTGEAAIANCVAYKLELERLTGVTPWLYTYPSFLREQCKNLAPKELQDCPMWLAWYPGYGHHRALTVDPIKGLGQFCPTLWKLSHWVAWQYDGDGGERMPNGVDCDYNVANGSIEDMLGLPAPSSSPDTIPSTPASKSNQTFRAVFDPGTGDGDWRPQTSAATALPCMFPPPSNDEPEGAA